MYCHPNRRTILSLVINVASCVFLGSCNPIVAQDVPTISVLPTVTEPSAEPNPIRQRVLLPEGAGAVAFGKGSVWVAVPMEQQVLRIDMKSGDAASPIALDFEPGKIAYGEGAAWVVSADHTRLVRIDPQTNEVAGEIELRSLQIPAHVLLLIAAGEGAVWITDQVNVIQIDPLTNQIVGQPLPVGEEIIAVALGHGTLWTGSHDDGMIARVDAKTHQVVASFNVGFSVHGLAVSEEAAWVLDEHGFSVVRIDPQTNQLGARISIDFIGANLAAGAGSVWVAPAARDSGAPTGNDGIARIGEKDEYVLEMIHAGDAATSDYYSVYFSEGSLWVLVNTPQPSLLEVRP